MKSKRWNIFFICTNTILCLFNSYLAVQNYGKEPFVCGVLVFSVFACACILWVNIDQYFNPPITATICRLKTPEEVVEFFKKSETQPDGTK